MMTQTSRAIGGYSLIELMISLAITAIIVSQLLLSFSAQYKGYVEQEQLNRTQQDVRVLTDVILADLRMAGFMVPKEFGVTSTDGGTAGSDILCMSDPAALTPLEYEAASDRYAATSVSSNLAGNDTTVTLAVGEMDIDGDGSDDYAISGGILISDGNTTHCAVISNISGGTVTFTPATPTGMTFSAPSTRAVPAMLYQISGSALVRNGLLLSTQVEDLQIEFGVDADGNGKIEGAEFPIHDLAGSDRSKVLMARISLTSRTAQPDANFNGSRAAAANRLAGGPDNFKRRKAVADAVFRNMK